MNPKRREDFLSWPRISGYRQTWVKLITQTETTKRSGWERRTSYCLMVAQRPSNRFYIQKPQSNQGGREGRVVACWLLNVQTINFTYRNHKAIRVREKEELLLVGCLTSKQHILHTETTKRSGCERRKSCCLLVA